MNIDWNDNFSIMVNQLCPPYPSCIEDYVGEQDTTNCNQSVEWNFSISEPLIEVAGVDDQWNPGETISIEMDFCNNSDMGHMFYPGVILESDSNLTLIFNDHYWFYGMDSDPCNTVQFFVLAVSSILSDTMITFIAYPEALNCQYQPEYCIDGDTYI